VTVFGKPVGPRFAPKVGAAVATEPTKGDSHMLARLLKWTAFAFVLSVLAAAGSARAQDKKDEKKDEIPKKVMDALKAKFPKAEIRKWTKETENGKVVYDIEFTMEKRNYEADIYEDGTYENWERAIEAKDLPKAVREAVDKKYPKAELKEVMEIFDVKDNKDVLHGYEVVLVTADKKDVEVTVAPDGKILEDSTDPKKDEKKDKK